VQLSSILRATVSKDSPNSATDNLTVKVRSFSRQPPFSRLCGYYAVAAAIAVCNNVDPTGSIYQVLPLVKTIKNGMETGKMKMVPVDNCRRQLSVRNVTYSKPYCICHTPWLDFEMVECSKCRNWFHTKCVPVSPPQLMRLSLSWLCASCGSDKLAADCVDLEEFEPDFDRQYRETSTPFPKIDSSIDENEANRIAISIPVDEETVSFS
jgi:hypothetical protein